MVDILLFISVCILIGVVALVFIIYKQNLNSDGKTFNEEVRRELYRVEASIKNEFSNNRTESNNSAKGIREEITNSFKSFGDVFSRSLKEINDSQKNQLESFSNNLNALTKSSDEKLTTLIATLESKLKEINETSVSNGKDNRKELRESLELFKKDFSQTVEDFTTTQRTTFSIFFESKANKTLPPQQSLTRCETLWKRKYRICKKEMKQNLMKCEQRLTRSFKKRWKLG